MATMVHLTGHRFGDLFEWSEAEGFSFKERQIAIGSCYQAKLHISGKDNYYAIIIVGNPTNRQPVCKIEIIHSSKAARYYYGINESSHYSYLNHATHNTSVFFDNMVQNHPEVAEWLLWYL